MEKINVAELLRKCPKGMELDCAMYENCTLAEVDENELYPIIIEGAGFTLRFSKYGQTVIRKDAKCVIFPKGKTTWEGFVPPCKFKDGDIVAAPVYVGGTWIGIFKQYKETTFEVYCSLSSSEMFNATSSGRHILAGTHLATEKEKEKLFRAIKANGYKWNPVTKTLKKLEPQYPKTYKECCDILGLNTMANDAQGYKWDLIIRMQELIICRDAYWKIAGEKMRLKKPWKPDYTIDEDGTGLFKFCIKNMGGKIKMVETAESNTILAFPSKEMRDAFYDNFKDSIVQSKELL